MWESESLFSPERSHGSSFASWSPVHPHLVDFVVVDASLHLHHYYYYCHLHLHVAAPVVVVADVPHNQ